MIGLGGGVSNGKGKSGRSMNYVAKVQWVTDVRVSDEQERAGRIIIIIIILFICDLYNHGLYRSKDFFISHL